MNRTVSHLIVIEHIKVRDCALWDSLEIFGTFGEMKSEAFKDYFGLSNCLMLVFFRCQERDSLNGLCQ